MQKNKRNKSHVKQMARLCDRFLGCTAPPPVFPDLEEFEFSPPEVRPAKYDRYDAPDYYFVSPGEAEELNEEPRDEYTSGLIELDDRMQEVVDRYDCIS